MNLGELIAALETAPEGNPELDGEIYRLTVPRTELRKCLKYSASIDAALTLAKPKGHPLWTWSIEGRLSNKLRHNFFSATITVPSREWRGCAPTAALALCIAILKARRG